MATQRKVLITGAGSGLGRALALRYAKAGCAVACVDIVLDRARETVTLLGGEDHIAVAMDVGSDAEFDVLSNAINSRFGELDLLVNNAGIASGGPMIDTTMEEWRELLEINLLSVVRGCRAFLPGMLERRRGRILNTASFAGLAGAPSMMTYGVSKAAVVALSDQLRAEVHGTGVTVSVACPAFFQTNLLENFRGSERMKGFADKMMAGGKDKLDEVADKIFAATERGQFLILPTRDEPKYWRMKRWFPEKYFHKLVQAVAKRARN
jgi:NAD(P)-dependent dehydrogenase (short-subunit alcohol dehydrogenase family)